MPLPPRPEINNLEVCPHGGLNYAELCALGISPDSVLDFGVYTVTCWTMLDTDTDHSNDSCSALFVVQGPAPAGASKIRIYTRAGEFICELPVPEGPVRPPWVDWDGKNHNGQLVAKGKYLCLLLDAEQKVITSYNALVPEQGQAVRLSTSRD